ncbi:hypothetical protein LCGC14_0235780 [marine sediment metagenome]|uniref:Uncharacterized protein n=1 Tax=marine sediment metagenome TaxID=412755 RepID=A0A0F9UQC7_9ZZZZ
MPYVVYSVISTEQMNTFALSSSWDESIVQFSIFDKNQSPSYITSIFDKLVSVFDRAVIVYESDTAIGCSREGSTGPVRLEDCWMMTADYMMSYV